jgi:hypothetical protein
MRRVAYSGPCVELTAVPFIMPGLGSAVFQGDFKSASQKLTFASPPKSMDRTCSWFAGLSEVLCEWDSVPNKTSQPQKFSQCKGSDITGTTRRPA